MIDQLDFMGAQVTTTASRDMLIYSADILREHVPNMVGLLSETIQLNKYDPKDIEDQIAGMEYDYEVR